MCQDTLVQRESIFARTASDLQKGMAHSPNPLCTRNLNPVCVTLKKNCEKKRILNVVEEEAISIDNEIKTENGQQTNEIAEIMNRLQILSSTNWKR